MTIRSKAFSFLFLLHLRINIPLNPQLILKFPIQIPSFHPLSSCPFLLLPFSLLSPPKIPLFFYSYWNPWESLFNPKPLAKIFILYPKIRDFFFDLFMKPQIGPWRPLYMWLCSMNQATEVARSSHNLNFVGDKTLVKFFEHMIRTKKIILKSSKTPHCTRTQKREVLISQRVKEAESRGIISDPSSVEKEIMQWWQKHWSLSSPQLQLHKSIQSRNLSSQMSLLETSLTLFSSPSSPLLAQLIKPSKDYSSLDLLPLKPKKTLICFLTCTDVIWIEAPGSRT